MTRWITVWSGGRDVEVVPSAFGKTAEIPKAKTMQNDRNNFI
jgi:hypothetical protein